jgi:hypothetical protein
MIILNNLSFVKSSGSSCRTPYDGILEKNGCYYLTFCHGNSDGDLGLQINDDMLSVSPTTIREVISNSLGYDIDSNSRIFIHPCFPNAVRKRYGNQLKDNFVFLTTGDWNDFTAHIIYNGREFLPLAVSTADLGLPVTLIVDSYAAYEKNGWVDDAQKLERDLLNHLTNNRSRVMIGVDK